MAISRTDDTNNGDLGHKNRVDTNLLVDISIIQAS